MQKPAAARKIEVDELYESERLECEARGRKDAEAEIAAAFEKRGHLTIADWIKRGGYKE